MKDPFDRQLDVWLLGEAVSSPPAGPERALTITRAIRQRPAWTFLYSWVPMVGPQRRYAARPLLYVAGVALMIGLLLGAAILVGAELRQPRLPIPAVENEPIPPPPEMQAALDMQVLGWGYGWRDVSPVALAPRISAEEATRLAGRQVNHGLMQNGRPTQDLTVADGLNRRTFVNTLDPAHREPANVWVVFFEIDDGYDCFSDAGGPGPCRFWEVVFIDDQTGEVVSGFHLPFPVDAARPAR